MIRHLVVWLAASLLVTAAPSAAAAPDPDHVSPSTAPPKFSSIPVGRMTTMPTKGRPSSVPRRESVPGIYPVLPAWAAKAPPRERNTLVASDPQHAEAVRTGAEFRGGESDGCFAEARATFRGGVNATEEADTEWGAGGSFTADTQVTPKHPDDPTSGVSAVHVERVIDQGGGASLESIDAWVDPATQGARLIARSVVPLVLAGTSSGTKVFVGRDERPNGKRFLQVVLVPPRGPTGAAANVFSRQAWVRAKDTFAHASCGHVRVALTLSTGAEANDHAVFQTSLLIGTAPAVTNDPRQGSLQELRIRNLAVQASISKVTKDPEPVVSISFAWAGREQTHLAPAGS
jgi:hypothetical protein